MLVSIHSMPLRLRSSSFTGHATASQVAALAPKRRRLCTIPPRRRPANTVSSNPFKSIVTTRLRSSWSHKPHFEAYSAWSYESKDGHGNTIEKAQAEFVFDPISMRMIPVERKTIQPNHESSDPQNSNDYIDFSPSNWWELRITKNRTTESTRPVEKLSRSAENSKSKLQPDRIKPNNEGVKPAENPTSSTKQTLESSWRQEGKTKHFNNAPAHSASSAETKSFDEAGCSSRDSINILTQRRRAFKQMNACELAKHRAALLNLWASRHSTSAGSHPSPATRKLNEEIRTVKQSMAALEDRRSHGSNTPMKPSSPPSNKAIHPENSASVAGEGDMCPNATSYAHLDHWYKRKAPHAAYERAQKSDDRDLIGNIRDIYESAYGRITESHKQGELRDDLKVYEDSLGPDPYTFRPEDSKSDGRMWYEDQYGVDHPSPEAKERQELSKLLKKYEDQIGLSPYEFKRDSSDGQMWYKDQMKMNDHQFTNDQAASRKDDRSDVHQTTEENSNPWPSSPLPSALSRYASTTDAKRRTETGSDTASKIPVNPVDPCLEPPPYSQIGNFASPTGFYQDIIEHPPLERPRALPSKSNPTVRKEEPVFSGSKVDRSNWIDTGSGGPHRHRRGRFGRDRHLKRSAFKHTLLSATIIGIFCYVTGVSVEILRGTQANQRADGEASPNAESRRHSNSWLAAASETKRQKKVHEALTAEERLTAHQEAIVAPIAPWIIAGGIVWAAWKLFGNGS